MTSLRRTFAFLRQMIRLRVGMGTVRDLPTWLRSFSTNAMDDRRPWITFDAARELSRVVTPGSRVFEFGSGGSTLYFDDTVGEVVSVEHDPAWADAVRSRVSSRVTLHVVEPIAEEPGIYASTDERYAGRSFRSYVETVDRYPDAYFDIVLVDGRARPASFLHAVPKLKPTGWLILDNSEREAYRDAFRIADEAGWRPSTYRGPHPYVVEFGETTIWRRTDWGSPAQEP